MKAYLNAWSLIVVGSIFFWATAAGAFSNDAALRGVTQAKSVFDVPTGEAQQLATLLHVIGETYDTLKKEGKKPVFVVTFRGPSLPALAAEKETAENDGGRKQAPLTAEINRLHELGVRFEACAVAARHLHIEARDMPSAVTMVGNTFVSLIGYQAQGYGLVPL